MTLTFVRGDRVIRKLELVQWHEVAKILVLADYITKLPAKRSCMLARMDHLSICSYLLLDNVLRCVGMCVTYCVRCL